MRYTCDALYRLPRCTAATNQRIQFDVEPSGRHLLTGGSDGWVLAFDLRTGELAQRLRVARDTVNGCALHPYLPMLATASGGWLHGCCTAAPRLPGCTAAGCSAAGCPATGARPGWPGSVGQGCSAGMAAAAPGAGAARPVTSTRPTATAPSAPLPAGERRYPLGDHEEEDEEDGRPAAGAGSSAAGQQEAQRQPEGLTNCLRLLRLEYQWMQYEQAQAEGEQAQEGGAAEGVEAEGGEAPQEPAAMLQDA